MGEHVGGGETGARLGCRERGRYDAQAHQLVGTAIHLIAVLRPPLPPVLYLSRAGSLLVLILSEVQLPRENAPAAHVRVIQNGRRKQCERTHKRAQPEQSHSHGPQHNRRPVLFVVDLSRESSSQLGQHAH